MIPRYEDSPAVSTPSELEQIVHAVFGRCNADLAAPQEIQAICNDTNGHLPSGSALPLQLTALCSFRASKDQAEQCIGVVERTGAYGSRDLVRHFSQIDLSPGLRTVAADHSLHSITDSNGDDELMLDINVVSAVSPAAHILVYFAPNADRGCLMAWQATSQFLA